MVTTCWLDGWRRVAAAPAIAAGVLVLTVLLAAPLAVIMRDLLRAHLGSSLTAAHAAEGVDYDWWQEFLTQTQGIGSTFTPAIVGAAATLDSISGVADGRRPGAPVAAAVALYLAGWTFLTGGILDRYARQRRTRAHGFFAACGVYFFRFVRLAIAAGLFYWWMFAAVHPWLFDGWYRDLTRDVTAERQAFAVRVMLYAAFGLVLALGNVVFDYAKVRAVVEDRRSMLGALGAAVRFVIRHPGRTLALYALNTLLFAAVVFARGVLDTGVPAAGASMWLAFAATQVFILARLLLKLHFAASQVALFQASLAHASYAAAPSPAWPDSPAAESLRT